MATVTKELRGIKLLYDSANDSIPTDPSVVPGDGGALIQHNFRKLYWVADFDSVTGKDSGVFKVNAGNGDLAVNIQSENDENLVYIKTDSSRVGIGTNTPTQKLDVNGSLLVDNGWIGVSAVPNVLTFAGAGDSTIPISKGVCIVHTNAAPGGVLYIDSGGVDGQILTIAYDSVQANNFHVSTADSTERLGFDSVTFTIKGQTATFQNINGQWVVIATGGTTQPPVN